MSRTKKPQHPEIGNVGLVCEEHTPKPDPLYATIPIEFYFGKFVKLGFPGKNPMTGQDGTEHMWVRVLGPAPAPPEELLGELYNHPITIMTFRHSDHLAFSRNEIEAIDGTDE